MPRLTRRGRVWGFTADIAKASALVWKVHPFYTLLVAVLTLIQGTLPAGQLWIAKLLVDAVAATIQGSTSGSVARLPTLAGMQAGLMLLSSLLGSVQRVAYALLGELLRNEISLQVLRKTNGLDISFFENEQFYNKLQNAFQETSERPLQIVSQLFRLVQTIVTLSTVIVLLSRLHWALLLLIVATALPILLVQNRYGELNYWMLRERAPELRKQQYVGSVLTSDWFIKEIRMFQLADYFLSIYEKFFAKFFAENRRLIVRRSAADLLASTCSILGWVVSIGYVVVRTVEHTITVGDFVLYTQAISTTQGQIQTLLGELSGLYANTLFIRNLFEFLSLPARNLAAGKRWSEPIEEIEFRNVSFHYPGTEAVVLHDVSFRICRGQSLALVGKNGAGKTTIAKLLCRLYEPTAGEILFNGKNVVDYSPQSLQEQIAVLFQDYGHYYLTARENIGFGRLASLNDMPAIRTAAQKGGADTFIEELPEKYETMLGRWFDEGVQLSVGEWQKVALSRAFLRRDGIIILDEPTSSLDAEAEAAVFENLLNDSSNRTTLLISHRFSTVRMADQILVLEHGRITEMGSHQDLMMVNGHYAYLFKLQAKGYES
jgi:ATP-binding cassette subfamily B protein